MLALPSNDYSQVDVLASWVELSVLREDSAFATRGAIREAISDSELFEDVGGLVTDIWNTLTRRRDVVGDAWPLEIQPDTIARRSGCETLAATAAYTAMLLIEAGVGEWYSTITLTKNDEIRTLFEMIVEASIRQTVRGTTIRFGAPYPSGWPKEFPGRVQRLADHFGVSAGTEDTIVKLSNNKQKDDSLDVVARLRITDEHEGSAYLLIQCATGKKWISDKTGQPSLALWREYVKWNGPAFKGIAVPFTLRRKGEMEKASIRHEWAVVLDRLRIAGGNPDANISKGTRKSIAAWCRKKLKKLRSI